MSSAAAEEKKKPRSQKRGPVGEGREKILNAAAKLFSDKGYDRTSMRDIASSLNIKAGSLYHHFEGKEELLLAVEEEAFRRITERVESALSDVSDPWERLSAACSAHLLGVLGNKEYINVTTRELPETRSDDNKRRFALIRNDYEVIFRELIDALPLAPSVDRTLFRLSLLGAMAWSLVWYEEGGKYVPDEIGHSLVEMLRHSTEKNNS